MSIQIMNAVWSHGPQDLPSRMLLLAIADNANERGEAYPSIATLGIKACLSKSSVIRTLRRLSVEGWLTVKQRAAAPEGYGRARGNLYCVSLIKLRLSSYGATRRPAEPRGVTVTPHHYQCKTSASVCEASERDDLRSVSVTPHRDEVSDEVSAKARRGVKSGSALNEEPSEPNEPTPQPPKGGPDDNDLEALENRARRLSRTSPEYFALARKIFALRKAAEESDPPPAELPRHPAVRRGRRRMFDPCFEGVR